MAIFNSYVSLPDDNWWYPSQWWKAYGKILVVGENSPEVDLSLGWFKRSLEPSSVRTNIKYSQAAIGKLRAPISIISVPLPRTSPAVKSSNWKPFCLFLHVFHVELLGKPPAMMTRTVLRFVRRKTPPAILVETSGFHLVVGETPALFCIFVSSPFPTCSESCI